MILFNTLRKMAGNKEVSRVTMPAHSVQVGTLPAVTVPAYKEYFVTRQQAERAAAAMALGTDLTPTIDTCAASVALADFWGN